MDLEERVDVVDGGGLARGVQTRPDLREDFVAPGLAQDPRVGRRVADQHAQRGDARGELAGVDAAARARGDEADDRAGLDRAVAVDRVVEAAVAQRERRGP